MREPDWGIEIHRYALPKRRAKTEDEAMKYAAPMLEALGKKGLMGQLEVDRDFEKGCYFFTVTWKCAFPTEPEPA